MVSNIVSLLANAKPQAVILIIAVFALAVAWKALDLLGRVIAGRKEDKK